MMLAGKVALITGASRGIGAAVARKLAERGVKLGPGTNEAGITKPFRPWHDLRHTALMTCSPPVLSG